MKVAFSTSENAQDNFAALFTDASFKDLMEEKEGKPFHIQECMLLVPEDAQEEGRMMAALKVGGTFYKGISQKIIEKVNMLIQMDKAGDERYKGFQFTLTKSAGRFGTFVLTLLPESDEPVPDAE